MNTGFSDRFFTRPASNGKYYLYLFLLWPFMAFITALTNYSQKEARKVVYIFLIYYGLTFVISNIGADAEGYALKLRAISKLPFSDFFKVFGGLYSSDNSVDIVEPFISFIVSRFTSHHSIYFAVWAAIFGFFYLKSFNLLHDVYQKNPGWNARIFMSFFIFILPITEISGVRMWTALWIFFYGAYHIILYRELKYFILTIGSSLVHFSFLTANAVLIIYFIAGNRNFYYLILAIISFVLPKLFSPFFQLISLKLGGGLQKRYEGYSSEGYVIGSQEALAQSSWFMRIGYDLLFYYLVLALIFIKIRPGYFMKEKNERNLFSFLLLFLSFVNFGKAIPALGGRFQILFFLMATFCIFLYFTKLPSDKVSVLTWVGLFPMLLYTAIVFRMGSETISAWIITPGFGLPLLFPGLSIADFLFR
jgi:hypothetical protein